MKKKWIIIAVSLILAGCIVFAGVMTFLGWDFTKLSTAKFNTSTHTFLEEFKGISIDTSTAEIILLPATDKNTTVVCYEQESVKHTVELIDDTLVIKETDQREWYQHIGINLASPKITLYLPQNEYGKLTVNSTTGDINIPADFAFEEMVIIKTTGDIYCSADISGVAKIETTTGDISVENAVIGCLDLSVTTGDITAKNIVCEQAIKACVSTGDLEIADSQCLDLISDGSTGDVSLSNVIAINNFELSRSTGDIEMNGCDATELFISTDTGSVSGTILSEKYFITETDTGKVNVPQSIGDGRCSIKTDTGNIEISIQY